jgi:hypothetical protein
MKIKFSEIALAIQHKLDFNRECNMPLFVTFNMPDYAVATQLGEYLHATASNVLLVDAEIEFQKDGKKFTWPNLFEIPSKPSSLVIIGQDKLDNSFYCEEVFNFYDEHLGNTGVYININPESQGFKYPNLYRRRHWPRSISSIFTQK